MFNELKVVCERYNNIKAIGEELDKIATKPFAEYIISQLNSKGYHRKVKNILCVTITKEKVNEFMRENPGDPHAKYGITGYIERALFYHDMKEYVSWDYTDAFKSIEFRVDVEKVLGGK